jgi:hypothetical protein
MTDEQRLTDALHEIVPTPPERPGRAPAVEELVRRRRRRTGAATMLAAVAVVVAAVAVPAALSGGGEVPETPVAQPTPELTCPPAGHKPTGPGTLPEGASAVRLCTGPGMPFDAPADALVTDPDQLVAAVNARPEAPEHAMCAMDLGRGYTLAFGYPGGEVRYVTGELYGCHELQVGSVTRTNAAAPYFQFVRMLRDQRARLDPPGHAAAPVACTDARRGDSPVARPGEMVVGTLCVHYPTASDSEPIGVGVPDEDLSVLLDDGQQTRPDAGYDIHAPTLLLVGETAWGDLTSRYYDAGWAPGPDAQAILDRLVAEAAPPTPEVDAGSSAEEVVAAYVDLLNAGDRDGAAALWHRLAGTPPIPQGYTRIDYKVEGVRPLRRISAYGDATAVTALYREVVRDAYAPYRRATFNVGRDEDGVLRIVHVNVGEVIDTGR